MGDTYAFVNQNYFFKVWVDKKKDLKVITARSIIQCKAQAVIVFAKDG